MAKYKFRSPWTRTIVYDPDGSDEIIAEFQDHFFETDDAAVAQKLEEGGYEEWSELTEEDEIPLPSGKRIKIKDLPKDIAKELIGKPVAVGKKVAGKIPGLPSGEEQNPAEFVCEVCGKAFASQAALNGHKAVHSQKSE